MAKIETTDAFKIGINPLWGAEPVMREFEFAVDALEVIGNGVSEDIVTANAIASIHATLAAVHGRLHCLLFEGVE